LAERGQAKLVNKLSQADLDTPLQFDNFRD